MIFTNEPLVDFTVAKERELLGTALSVLDAKLSSGPLKAFPIIDGKEILNLEQLARTDPSDTRVSFSTVHLASAKEVEAAITSLRSGAHGWHKIGFETRAKILEKIADSMKARRYELSAIIIREAGKPWKEADADVAEAIDFCRYYALEMRRLGPPKATDNAPGEATTYFYKPRGIAVIIAPWNFPLAIACGMTVAALVTGNATILKPAEQTSVIAYEFAKIVLGAGVPTNAFAFLPGYGEIIGPLLTTSQHTDVVCFTGSKPVGLEIIKSATLVSGYVGVKKIIAEMGGKNAIIVDEDADLDEAIKGTLYSSFGYAGQKCSACSRIIVVGSAYESFLKRFCEAAGDVIVGRATDPGVFLGPVIDSDAHARILKTIKDSKTKHTAAFEYNLSSELETRGYYVPPTVFKDVDVSSALWNEEIFGPVVAITKAENFSSALKIANNSQYALTGGVFSRSPKHLKIAQEDFLVGNLYLNRTITGAFVGRHPFGGFRFSGVGSKGRWTRLFDSIYGTTRGGGKYFAERVCAGEVVRELERGRSERAAEGTELNVVNKVSCGVDANFGCPCFLRTRFAPVLMPLSISHQFSTSCRARG